MEDSPSTLSLGRLCEDMDNSYSWLSGKNAILKRRHQKLQSDLTLRIRNSRKKSGALTSYFPKTRAMRSVQWRWQQEHVTTNQHVCLIDYQQQKNSEISLQLIMKFSMSETNRDSVTGTRSSCRITSLDGCKVTAQKQKTLKKPQIVWGASRLRNKSFE